MKYSKLGLGIAAAAIVAGASAFVVLRQNGNAAIAQGGHPAMPVPVANVVKRNVPIYLDYSARAESIRNVVLQPKISGYVQGQPAVDGADVEEGALLYQIDPRDYQAALDQAKAQAERDAAALDYAKSNRDRGSELAKSGYLAKDNFDQRTSNLKQAEAVLAADAAAIRQAENNLAYTQIRAPFAGRLGRNKAPVGTLVSGSGASLNTIVQLDPIYVTFNPSETELAQIHQARTKGAVVAEIILPGDEQAKHFGEVTFIDNAVDPGTGTITVRATVKNQDHALLPGQYARVRLRVKELDDALMVPQAAVGSSQLGKYLYVVADGKAEMRTVTLGPIQGTEVAVLGGIDVADQVIVGNLQKIGPGAPVQPLPPQQRQADAAQ
jgi:multidrug efflux system membrane fusion protein